MWFLLFTHVQIGYAQKWTRSIRNSLCIVREKMRGRRRAILTDITTAAPATCTLQYGWDLQEKYPSVVPQHWYYLSNVLSMSVKTVLNEILQHLFSAEALDMYLLINKHKLIRNWSYRSTGQLTSWNQMTHEEKQGRFSSLIYSQNDIISCLYLNLWLVMQTHYIQTIVSLF